MSPLSTTDEVEQGPYNIQGATTSEGKPAILSGDSGLEQESLASSNGDDHDSMTGSPEILEWLSNFCYVVEGGSEEPVKAKRLESIDESLKLVDDKSEWSASQDVDRPETLPYGGIAVEDLANSEKYSNEFLEVKRSPLGGHGVFAKTDLKRGQIIHTEQATLTASPVNLYRELDQLPPELQQAFSRLHCYRRSPDQDERHATFMTNAFAIGNVSCIYLIASRFNHACHPLNSVENRVIGNYVMEFSMKRDVPAGAELTIAYDEEIAQLEGASDAEGVW
ncbi:SET domain-containing protein [Hypoxylon sp. FL1857]|nr:SET domain-containing protein [Hypoxylon sp. FL1857]